MYEPRLMLESTVVVSNGGNPSISLEDRGIREWVNGRVSECCDNDIHLPHFPMQIISSSPFCNADVDAVALKSRKLGRDRENPMYSK
jgi:hypothetical protein